MSRPKLTYSITQDGSAAIGTMEPAPKSPEYLEGNGYGEDRTPYAKK